MTPPTAEQRIAQLELDVARLRLALCELLEGLEYGFGLGARDVGPRSRDLVDALERERVRPTPRAKLLATVNGPSRRRVVRMLEDRDAEAGLVDDDDDDDGGCEGHESTAGAVGHFEFCDGSCRR